ncbi:MAG: hypothetical protein KatS3mg115_2583 [Candidatus Poribacteria bacterium]|nr:MAG: hypothetical protein KatS3mg115_2583 [Candidatus Poribacteria bacterium]
MQWDTTQEIAQERHEEYLMSLERASEAEERSTSHPALAAYIREISREPLLSREEEILLFTTLDEARQTVQRLLSQVAAALSEEHRQMLEARTLRYEELIRVWEEMPPSLRDRFGAAERAEIQRAFASWKAARERLLKANLRLVIYTVKRFRNDPNLFLDLIQEGNIGLMRAIDRYDLSRSSKFSTYALWWIWQAVNRAYSKNVYTVRIPVYKVQQVGRYHRKRRALEAHLDREPSEEEVAQAVGISPEEVQQITELQANAISLDDLSGEDLLAVTDQMVAPEEDPEAEAIHHDMETRLRELLETLPEREAQVLRWRYGIDAEVHTLQEIGERLQVSRERVRQLEQQAIGRLIRSEQIEALAEYR